VRLEEAYDCSQLALWSSSLEEFVLNPESGVVWWRPVGETSILHGNSWQPAPEGVIIPADGWTHRLYCECPHCR
jgi:hypothetical protein